MKPHLEGYEYQDCLCAYFILKDILEDGESTFRIDIKENKTDKFDDLTITNETGISKKQIKYSNEINNHKLSKADISSGNYDLAIDLLYNSWNNYDDTLKQDIRLCLSWKEPTDKINQVIYQDTNSKLSFDSQITKVFKINIKKLWPKGKTPLDGWQRLKNVSEKIDRDLFSEFCSKLVIEVDFPKFSLDIQNPGELEIILIDQMRILGIGEYPNDKITIEDSLLRLFHLIKRCRSKGTEINTSYVLNYLRIKTDYGEIPQRFPINESLNIRTTKIITEIKNNFNNTNLVILVGEPGSGKSWAIENLIRELKEEGKNVVKHFCFTSLEDELQKDRIKTNTFYGNLIADLLRAYPYLKKYKTLKYASILSELNLLLENIEEETYLIIDGLDHISRIYERFSFELSKNEIDIINKISRVEFGNSVKCLLVSQPIKELDIIKRFEKYNIPLWTENEIVDLLNKYNISDVKINDVNLSIHLLEKSQVNPLYLTYIIEELKNLKSIQKSDIDNLPTYSYNLENYYGYLLGKSNLYQDIPRILAGASFRLNKEEIKQITRMGDVVDSSLEILSPILKRNYAKYGYTIYHESFRRYIIDYLVKNNISIFEKVYKPLIYWLENQDFFTNYKSYRYYFPLLLEGEQTKTILNYLSFDFLAKSLYNGHSWELIRNNYQYLLTAAIKEEDFPSIVTLSEIKNTLISVEPEFDESFENYFRALGSLKGFDIAVNYLTFEDKPTLDLGLGIKACYICDIHDVTPPWDLYWAYFDNTDEVSSEEFKIIVRYNFINNTDFLKKIVRELIDNSRTGYLKVFKSEFTKYKELHIKELLLKEEWIQNLFNRDEITDSKLEVITSQIIDIEHFAEGEVNLLNQFFYLVEDEIKKNGTEIINYLYDQLKTRNWFYNWIIYYIKIIQIKYIPNFSFLNLKEAFKFLVYDTKPFKGKPRTCDLYKAEEFIHDSLTVGLSYLKTKEEWDEILEILKEVSEKTTTSLQKTLVGPLSTNDFLYLLENNANQNNIEKVISLFEETIEKEKDYNLYSYLAEYNFRLSKIYSKVNNQTSAESCFIKGIEYLLSYTFRKDNTLDELIESIESINNLDNSLGSDYIKKIKIHADTVINHTDGKGTSHYPISWFSKYLEIDFPNALLFLMNSLSNKRYDWRLEDCLINLLNKSNGSINPLLELLLTKTFPIENSEKFLSTSINLTEKIENEYPHLARNSYSQIATKYEIEKRTSDRKSETICERLLLKLRQYDIFKLKIDGTKKEIGSNDHHNDVLNKNVLESINELIKLEPISELNYEDLAIYLEKNKIGDNLINSLCYYFEPKNELTEDLKKITKILVRKDIRDRGRLNERIKIVFSSNPNFYLYFLICRYIYEMGDWYGSLVNINTYIEAYTTDPQLSTQFLFELLGEILQSEGYNLLLSANLINTLVKIQFEKNVITRAWENLYNIIDSRLPDKDLYNWNDTLSDEMNMCDEERMICLLFTRLKTNTTERHHYASLGIYILLRKEPAKFIKPFKWFLKNFNDYLEITKIFFLELLWYEGKDIHSDLSEELGCIYPTNDFSIDYLIEKLINVPKRKRLIIPNKLEYPLENEGFDFYKGVNVRHQILDNIGISLENIFGEFQYTFRRKYEKKTKLYANRVHKKYTRNIYSANYLLKLINENLYDEFRTNSNSSEDSYFSTLKIDYITLLAQQNSIFYRPSDLNRPSNILTKFQKTNEIPKMESWVRLGHFESELYEKNYASGFTEIRSFGGIIFNNDNQEELPFSQYRLNPAFILNSKLCNYELDKYLVYSFLQLEDMFEYYKLIWLNPILVNRLNLTMNDYSNGIIAKNKNGEIVLRYNSWYSDYVGNERIDEEIPKLDGCELLVREDHFQKILNIYGETPYYYVLRV